MLLHKKTNSKLIISTKVYFFSKKALTKVSEMCILLLAGRKNVSHECKQLFCGSYAIRFSYKANMKRFSILGNQHQHREEEMMQIQNLVPVFTARTEKE